MKNIIYAICILSIITILGFGCEQEPRNIVGTVDPEPIEPIDIEITPTNINDMGFEFLAKMEGHWVGTNRVITDDYSWFAFDLKAMGIPMFVDTSMYAYHKNKDWRNFGDEFVANVHK